MTDTSAPAQALATLLLRPRTLTRRVIDRYTVGNASIRVETTLEFRHPLVRGTWVPLVRLKRGRLVNNLRVDQPATPTTTLNRYETQLVISSLINGWVTRALAEEGLEATTEGRLIRRLLEAVPLGEPSESKNLIHAMEEFRQAVRGGTLDEFRNSARIMDRCLAALVADDELLEFVRFYRTHRVLLLPVPENTTKVVYSLDLPVGGSVRPTRRERLRTALGQSPHHHIFEIPLARTTPSYHFRMDAPAGQYVRSSQINVARYLMPARADRPPNDWELRPLVNERKMPDASPHSEPAHVVGEGGSADGVCHIYIGGTRQPDRTGPRRLFASVVFNERPGGLLGSSLVQALVVLGTLLMIYVIGGRLVPRGQSSTDAVAILVTLPGVLTLVTRPRRGQDPFFSPILVPISSLLSVLTSVLGAGILLWWSANLGCGSKDSPCPQDVPMNDGVRIAFLGVVGIQLLVTALLAWRLTANIKRYSALVSESFADKSRGAYN